VLAVALLSAGGVVGSEDIAEESLEVVVVVSDEVVVSELLLQAQSMAVDMAMKNREFFFIYGFWREH
jgi:hypothetical protein